MLYVTAALLAAACLPPLPRVVGFVGGGAAAGAALGMLSRRCLLLQWVAPQPAAPAHHQPVPAAVVLYWRELASATMAAELALYLSGALAFLRNGGHDR